MNRFGDMKARFSGIHDLMKFRVTEILLISTAYDAYVLEEDGMLIEQIYHHFNDLSIPFIPRIHWVADGEDAWEELKLRPIHLIITMSRISDMSSFEVETKIHEAYPNIPIVMLSYDRLTPEIIARIRAISCIDRVFHWSGDNKVLVAIIKYIEDKQNVEADSKLGVQAILLVDDSPAYYSQILPTIYTEILTQTRYLVLHAMNIKHGLLRVRLRPKILLAETYEEAMEIISKYRHNLLGIISDVRFPKNGVLHPQAGIELNKIVRENIPDLPFLLQSEEAENAAKAEALRLDFLNKNSPKLLQNIRTYILENYGFGSFVFKYPDGRVIDKATDITNLERIIRDLPDASLYYHAKKNDFSRWFRARAEVEVADRLRFVDTENVSSAADIRAYILKVLNGYFQKYQSGLVLDFEGLSKKDMENAFIKLGTGSLGGKARGVAFMNGMIAKAQLADKYEDMKIKVPRSFVIGSDAFEKFIEENKLYSFLASGPTEAEIAQKFTASPLPAGTKENLLVLTQYIKCPLAVRSSSILEDSRILPFAGIYNTYVVPNCHADPEIRVKQLEDAVKLVYASVFYAAPVQYAKNADIRIEEEKMAVLIQELVGEHYGDYYYPAISGVAQSYNFYPYDPLKPEDGIVSLALGLGKAIVEGERVYRFSPAYPKLNPLVSGPKEYLEKSQHAFYAINFKDSADITLRADEDYIYKKLLISQAHKDQSLEYIGSTYSVENDCIYDNIYQQGPKLVTFAPILKYNRLPLRQIIKDLLGLGKQSFGTDVEIEFAVNIPKDKSKPKEFNFLQIRPMVVGREAFEVNMDEPEAFWCFSHHTIGNGSYQNIHDIIFVDPADFNLQDSVQIANEIGELNQVLIREGRRCILVGFGRMGTADRWLGIPLTWEQMSRAMIIVEVDLKNLRPEPSLGSHFFHNLTATGMGYFHIQYDNQAAGMLDWEWLLNQPVLQQTKFVKLVRRQEPFRAKIDGRSFKGIIYK
ncbi:MULTISPECIES: PEP/pyruvate-binding domain-containing protein [Sporomusa]|uniref:PEP/pyruvate-binding domain-containing protein n=1 Tax=Sporomusa TaxID=2375 RepID=UPI002BD22641|nr:PEP/pyruvate-binding domain-containing protein [Sporomusa sphaeroides]HML34731.1 PEP/pyruvate-binding domain-containing protein [Sporomusa sphaeroides]